MSCQGQKEIKSLDTPNIRVIDGRIIINNVDNATNFIVYIVGEEGETIDKTYYDLTNLSQGVHFISVIATDNTKKYSNSTKSNIVFYEKKSENNDPVANVSYSIYQNQYDVNQPLEDGSWDFTNQVGDVIKLISSEQIKDRKTFKILADQLASNVDDETLSWKGEFWGKMVWGGANIYKYTQDSEVYEVLKETITYVMSLQENNGRINIIILKRKRISRLGCCCQKEYNEWYAIFL